MDRKNTRVFVILFATSLVIRLLWAVPAFLKPTRIFDPDSYLYHRLAVNILNKHSFTADYPVENHPEFFRTPGYPIFLSLVYAAFGVKPLAVVLVQVLIGAIIPFLAYLCFAQVLPENVSFWGALCLTLLPEFSVLSSFILTETIYVLFVVITFLMFLKSIKEDNVKYIVITLFLAAVATYVRPEGLILLPAILLVYLFMRKKGILRTIGTLGIGVIAYIIVLTPWIFRNYLKTGKILLSTVTEVNTAFIDIPIYKNWLRGVSEDPESTITKNWMDLKKKHNWTGESIWSTIESPEIADKALKDEIGSLSVPALLFFPVFKLIISIKLLFNPGMVYFRKILLGPKVEAKRWLFFKTIGTKNSFLKIVWAIRSKFMGTPFWFILLLTVIYASEFLLLVIGLLGAVSLLRRRALLIVVLPLLIYILLAVAAGPNMNMRYRAHYEFLFVPWWGYGILALKGWLKGRKLFT